MPPRSSARFVSYDLRPAKQSERKLLIDTFVIAMEAGLSISEYRYVGMGANRFYDFLMLHKYLGISNMVSIEHDRKMFQRAMFNRPFQFIHVLNKKVHDFLLDDDHAENTIYWLDYDGPIHANITNDISSLGSKARVGDFVFVTLAGMVPRRYFRLSSSANRLSDLKDVFGDLANGLEMVDVEDATFYDAVFKIISTSFTHAFSARGDGEFKPFFRVRYADTVEMVTFGGMFGTKDQYKPFLDILMARIPFLDVAQTEEHMFRIRKFDLTEKERGLFDLAVTARRSNAKEIGQLVRLGFAQEDLRSYRELLRYHPRYVETLI